jgi:hypothetical protein
MHFLCEFSVKGTQNENFFGNNFEVLTISLLVMLKCKGFVKKIFDWAIMGGGTIVPRSVKNKKC